MATMTRGGDLQARLAERGIGAGDEVVVPSYGGEHAAAAVRGVGALPVFADIEASSLCLDPSSVADVVSERTAAVVPVHLFGHRADLMGMRRVTEQRGLAVVEYPSAYPSPVEAARRRANAEYLGVRLTGVVTPPTAPEAEHGYERYVIRVPGNGRPDRDAFAHALRLRGVPCHVPVPVPAHRMPAYRSSVSLPETERAVGECLALPAGPDMTARDLRRVVSACNALGGLLLEPAC